jgi:ElaB/YqjD/DUF883 family membrane-anchored ribosome-binding protein
METAARPNTPLPGNDSASGETILNRAFHGAHKAVDNLASAADDAARKVQPAIERVANAAHHTVDKVAGAAAPTAVWLREQEESLNATRQNLVQGTCKYVSKHPVQSLAVALVTGFLLSRFLR